MKKMIYTITILIVVSLICGVLFSGCHNYPNLDGISQYSLAFKATEYKASDWKAAQGLTSDGVYFYFAGHNDRTNETADIHVIDAESFEEVKVLSRIGVLHGAEVEYNPLNDSLLVCSGGNERTPNVREIDKNDGSSINYWDFEGIGENGGTLITLTGENSIILFTSSQDGAKIAFTPVTLKANGAYDTGETIRFDATDLGVPQGLDYHNSYLYYLADGGKTVSKNPHYIYKISLDGGKVNILSAYSLDFDTETEGLYIANSGEVYFGDAKKHINKVENNIANWEN